MKKLLTFEFKRALVAVALVVTMAASSAVSFAYWKTGITGDDANKNLNVIIGSGNAVSSSINLSEAAGYDGKSLIPFHRIPNQETEVTEISFSINVTWVLDDDGKTDNLENVGHLTVKLESITLQSDPSADLMNLISSGTTRLFDVQITGDNSITGKESGATPVVINVRVRLNEPADRYQYNLIAGQVIVLTLNFDIQSTYDLEIPEQNPDN